MTPIGAVVRGLAAGTVGTAAMDLFLFARYRRGGGTSSLAQWESSSGVSEWAQAPAPAQVGRRLIEGLFQTQLDDKWARLLNNVTHWAFGTISGAQYGLLAGSLPAQRIVYGLPFGAAVWTGGYVILPATKLYEPIWKYDRDTLAKDLSAHLVYGLATSSAMRALSARTECAPGTQP